MEVNLRPVEYTRKKTFYLPRLLITLLACTYILGILFFVISLKLTQQQLVSEQTVFESEITMLKPVVDEVLALQAKNKAYAEKQDLIDRLTAEAPKWSAYVSELHAGRGERLRIVEFRGIDDGTVQIRCVANSLETATEFVHTVRGMESYKEAGYEVINLTSEGIEIRITATLARGGN